MPRRSGAGVLDTDLLDRQSERLDRDACARIARHIERVEPTAPGQRSADVGVRAGDAHLDSVRRLERRTACALDPNAVTFQGASLVAHEDLHDRAQIPGHRLPGWLGV